MSRIGKNPIQIPAGVNLNVSGSLITVKGPKGQLELDTHNRVSIDAGDGRVVLDRPGDDRQSRAYHGLYQRLLSNIVTGVTQGFKKDLEIQGVGYRAQMDGKTLVCLLGYSHPVRYDPPAGIELAVPDQTHISVMGADKQQVGQIAAIIRGFRKPEPYKGKGIRYVGEHVRKKVGKTGSK